jgi:hypothetical protein
LTFPTTVRQKYAKSEQIYSEIFEKFTLWAKSALMKDSVLETLSASCSSKVNKN